MGCPKEASGWGVGWFGGRKNHVVQKRKDYSPGNNGRACLWWKGVVTLATSMIASKTAEQTPHRLRRCGLQPAWHFFPSCPLLCCCCCISRVFFQRLLTLFFVFPSCFFQCHFFPDSPCFACILLEWFFFLVPLDCSSSLF